MDDRKICFIMCTNNKIYEKECIKYINSLEVPKGYTIEQLSIIDAPSMAAGYNEGMRASDARYKIYLHQDVFITNKHLISDILKLFADQQIGLIGMVGAEKLPPSCVMWDGPRIGTIYDSGIAESSIIIAGDITNSYQEVEAVDGLLMITQYDIPWREDIFDGWDFYDVSQSTEFLKHGYKVIVPHMDTPWCLHDDGMVNLENYFHYRDIYEKEYCQKTINK